MTNRFIYVFSQDDRDLLSSLGFVLLKSDDEASIYVFINDERRNFEAYDMRFALSDTLTF